VRQKLLLNETFWSADKSIYAFALDKDNKRVDEASVLTTVPMWFALLDEDKARAMITQLAGPDHETDWGMRIISSRAPKYSASGYHFGSVWPLFTGWASVGEYRYHRALPAYANLRANAQLALDGAAGHVTEVLSGDYYQPLSTSSPHQIWSAAMVINPLLRGLFGLEGDATTRQLSFAPHVPADWTSFAIENVHVGSASLDLNYRKTTEEITLETRRNGTGDCTLEFSPAVSPHAEVMAVEINGRPIPFRVRKSDLDQHVTVRFSACGGPNTLQIRLRDEFGLSLASVLPPLGSTSRGLRVVSESWTPARDSLMLEISGAAGTRYELSVWNPSQIASVEGAELVKGDGGKTRIRIQIASNTSEPYRRQKITFHFSGQRNGSSGEHKKGK
jgi:hypothetical protein